MNSGELKFPARDLVATDVATPYPDTLIKKQFSIQLCEAERLDLRCVGAAVHIISRSTREELFAQLRLK